MAKLKLGPLLDDKPVKLSIEIPATTYCDLRAYAAALAAEIGETVEPMRLIAPMLARFMATDRAFRKAAKPGSPAKDDIRARPPL